MNPGLRRGNRIELKVTVKPWMRPRLGGMVGHKLYATWAMVYHMEVAARRLLQPYLEDDEEAVGAGVVLEHLAPAPIGAEVRLVCIISRVKKNKIYCHLDAYWKTRKIGRGSHLQVVMSRRQFENLGGNPPTNGQQRQGRGG